MSPTRFEMMNELRRLLGMAEETEMLIDWVQDAWQTYDLLIERIGEEYAHQIMNAINLLPEDDIQNDLTAYDHTRERANQCLLN